MSAHFHSHLNSAVAILEKYKGEIPFHIYLKKYFSANKKFGSNDRRQITSLCYNYFRLGNSANNVSLKDKILLGIFLCENNRSSFRKHKAWMEWSNWKSSEEKISIISYQLSIEKIFPFKDELSFDIDAEKFNQSF